MWMRHIDAHASTFIITFMFDVCRYTIIVLRRRRRRSCPACFCRRSWRRSCTWRTCAAAPDRRCLFDSFRHDQSRASSSNYAHSTLQYVSCWTSGSFRNVLQRLHPVNNYRVVRRRLLCLWSVNSTLRPHVQWRTCSALQPIWPSSPNVANYSTPHTVHRCKSSCRTDGCRTANIHCWFDQLVCIKRPCLFHTQIFNAQTAKLGYDFCRCFNIKMRNAHSPRIIATELFSDKASVRPEQ